jgi:hypothetical protein
MSEANDLMQEFLNAPRPVRRYVIGWPRYAAFYKMGRSWVVFVKLPNGGMIHLAHWKWWEPLRLLPHAIIAHWRLARS